MHQETFNKISDYFTLLLNESTDEANQSKLSLLNKILNDHKSFENCEMWWFLNFQQHWKYMREHNLDITKA